MRLRSTTVQAPETRVYTHEPRLRQKRFSDRVKAVRSLSAHRRSGKPSLRKQQTLTQLDFDYQSSSRSSRDLEPLKSSEEGWEGSSRSTKRRKPNRTEEDVAEIKRQNTLTQMRGFLRRGNQDIDVEEEDETESEKETMMEGTKRQSLRAASQSRHDEPGWHASFQEDDKYGVPHSAQTTSHAATPSQPHSAMPIPFPSASAVRGSPSTPVTSNQKREIPSSQSPPASPLSTQHGTPTRALAKSQRTPLQEIHPNILAQRDSASPPKKLKTRHPQSTVQDSVCNDLDSGGDENSDPDELALPHSPTKKPYSSSSQLRRCFPYVSSPPTTMNTDHTTRTSEASTLSESSSPFKRPPLPPHALARRANGSASPTSSPNSSPLSPRDQQQQQSSPARPATFVDSQWSLNIDSPPRFPSLGPDDESELSNVSELPIINDSADIVTASQLCPRSSLE